MDLQDSYENLDLSLNRTENSIDDFRQLIIAKLAQKALLIKDLDIFIENASELIHKALNTDIFFVFRLNENKNRLNNYFDHSLKDEYLINSFIDIEKKDFFDFLLKNNNNPVLSQNFANDSRFNKTKFLEQNNFKSGIGITISSNGTIIGLLCFLFKKEETFSSSDITFVHSVSFILSTAIKQFKIMNKLREDEEQSRILMEYASDAIIVFDLEGNIFSVNSKACDLTNFSKEELLGKKIEDLYISDGKVDYKINLNSLKEKQNLIFERNLLKKNGQYINVEVNAKILPNGYVQSIYRDLTTRKENEELIRIAQKMEAIGRVSGGIAHDFNNYLSIISGYVEKLLELDNDEINVDSFKEDLFHVKKTTDKASHLVRELLTFSRAKSFHSESVNINDLLLEMKHSIRSFLGEKTNIYFELADDIYNIKINPDQLWQSILNLIINAKDSLDLKNSKEPSLMIKTFNYTLEKIYNAYSFNALPGDYVGISINDNGMGLSAIVKSHLFEPFFTTKNTQNGTGLGLSSIYGFVKIYGGFIKVESLETEYASFSIFLKRSLETNEQKKNMSPKLKKKNNNKVTNILLVEDNDDLRELLTEVLIKKDYKAQSSSNGKQALELIKKTDINFDLIITDIIMPELDGVELINSLHAMNYSTRIIAMSGYTIKDPLSLHSDVSFISKPFSINTLLSMISNHTSH